MRDALPDLVHGRLSPLDRETMSAHVESCAACTAEIALLRDVRRTAALTPAIDIARVVAALPAPSPSVTLPAQAAEKARRDGTGNSASRGFPGGRALWSMVATIAVMAAGGLSVITRNDDGDRNSGANTAVAQSPVADDQADPSSPPRAAVASAPGGTPEARVGQRVTTAASTPAGEQRDAASGEAQLTLVAGVDELSDAHIEQLLSEMDEMEDLPASEPDPVAIGLENLEGGA